MRKSFWSTLMRKEKYVGSMHFRYEVSTLKSVSLIWTFLKASQSSKFCNKGPDLTPCRNLLSIRSCAVTFPAAARRLGWLGAIVNHDTALTAEWFWLPPYLNQTASHSQSWSLFNWNESEKLNQRASLTGSGSVKMTPTRSRGELGVDLTPPWSSDGRP